MPKGDLESLQVKGIIYQRLPNNCNMLFCCNIPTPPPAETMADVRQLAAP